MLFPSNFSDSSFLKAPHGQSSAGLAHLHHLARLDWLIYTILHHIVPYYMRKHGRNAWRDEQRNLAAFRQSGLLAVALLAFPGAAAAPANPVRVAAGLAHAERAQSEALDAQLASLASKLAEARAAASAPPRLPSRRAC